MQIPHSRPTLTAHDRAALAKVIESQHVAQGPVVREFEHALAAYVGVAGGVAVNSGSSAIELALVALGVETGDEVILPSYVCTGPWLAVKRIGAVPKVVDISRDDYGLDPEAVRAAISPRTKAILVAHMFGLPADLTRLASFGIPLIEDCAQTLGAVNDGHPIGSIGQVTVCSFYATKLLCTGEGGMLLSNDAGILARARELRDYDEAETLDARAFNRKMTDLQAALGVAQLQQLPSFLARRVAIAGLYTQAFRHLGVMLPRCPAGRTHVYFRYVLSLPRPREGQDALLVRMAQRGVQCRKPVFRPLHRYLGSKDCPIAEEVFESAISVPIYPSLTEQEMAYVVGVLCEELA